MPSNANPFTPDNSDPALQPVAPPVDPSLGGVPQVGAPPSGGYVDTLRAFLHGQIDKFANAPGLFDGVAMAAPIFNAEKAVASYVPGPASDTLQSGIDTATNQKALADTLHSAVDTALDPATRAQAVNSVGRGARQALSGFNAGLGNVVFTPADALDSATNYVAGKIANVIGAAPPPTLPSMHDFYNNAFVAPAGAPATPMETRIRGTAQSFGNNIPAILLGGGVGAAGIRSGVTMAEQAAPALLEKISAPAETVAGKIRDLIPNFLNGLQPTNIANAVRTSNLQGAANSTLQQVASHPAVTGYVDLSRDWRNEKRRQAQEAAQPVPPSN
jgi:hypothetical protein